MPNTYISKLSNVKALFSSLVACVRPKVFKEHLATEEFQSPCKAVITGWTFVLEISEYFQGKAWSFMQLFVMFAQ